ncbi:9509_t:CDS:1, partial [Gigaspora rosea]
SNTSQTVITRVNTPQIRSLTIEEKMFYEGFSFNLCQKPHESTEMCMHGGIPPNY